MASAIDKNSADRLREEGREARRRSDEFFNPYRRGTIEARIYYEGWCDINYIRFLASHPELK